MSETTPQYITELRKHIDIKFGEVSERLDKVDVRLVKVDEKLKEVDGKFNSIDEQFENIKDKLDVHFEAIGELKVEVTTTNILLRKKAYDSELKDLANRTKKLEKAVFA